MTKVKDGRKAPFFWADRRIISIYGARMKPTGVAVYCCLASHANQQRESFPSLRVIAEEVGIDRRSVVRVIDRLQELGLIEVRERRVPGSEEKRSNIYILCDVPEPSLFDERPPSGVVESPRGDTVTPPSGVVESPRGDTIARPSLEMEQESGNKKSRGATNPDFDLTAQGCATAYVWYARGIPDRERNLDMLAAHFEELAAHHVPYEAIQAHIRDPSRPKCQYLWEFRSKWKEVLRGEGMRSAGTGAGGHMGFNSRIGSTPEKLAAIAAKTIRAGEAAPATAPTNVPAHAYIGAAHSGFD